MNDHHATSETAICSNCGAKGVPRRNVAKGLLRAAALILSVPAVMLLFGGIWGAEFLHDNSMFLTLAFLVAIGAAIALGKGAFIGACPECGIEPMVLLSTPQGQHLAENVRFRSCPKCGKAFSIDASVLRSSAESQRTTTLPCPSCRQLLSVDMRTFEVTEKAES